MIKTALKNFFKNLVYLFVAMGIVYLFLLLMLFGLVTAVGNNLVSLIRNMAELLQTSVDFSSASVADYLAYAYGQIDWSANFFSVLRQVLETRWISGTLKGFLETLKVSVEGFDEKLGAVLSAFVNRLLLDVILAAVFFFIGLLLANFATGALVRHRSAKKGFKKFLLARFVVPVAQTLVIALSIVIFSFIHLYAILVVIGSLCLLGVLSLLSSWIVHRDGDLKLKDVLTTKNVFMHLAVIAIILLIDAVIAVGLVFLNPILAVLLLIPIVIYSFNIIEVNTDSYVIMLVEKGKAKRAELPAAEGTAEEGTEEANAETTAENATAEEEPAETK